ncbi:MAG: alanine--glyoxylate aminotransferase family protein [Clostridia bacterium]|nr:alanine--glyoxylate aminotransferase family protein [Clostridia bacterium]
MNAANSPRPSVKRLLMGPGPSSVSPRVLQAMAMPTIGHLDPEFLAVMNDTAVLLREAFETGNSLAIPISGTGSAGMEAALVNVVEPGDRVLVAINGFFGLRMADIVQRCRGELTTISAPWGHAFDPADVIRAIREKHPKVVAIVHAETSTGVLQPLREIGKACREAGAMFVADMVTSLAGTHVGVDDNLVDVAYSGSQKCLSCPPGMAPITLNDRATTVVMGRKSPVQSWYLDLSMINRYWGSERFYHHTAPINMVYALHEALLAVSEEGLDARACRHSSISARFACAVEAMGLALLVPKEFRTPMLACVITPEGIDEAGVRKELLLEYGIEIGGGLGELKGRIWRIGLMGESCTLANATLVIAAIGQILHRRGCKVDVGAGLRALGESLS